MIDIHCHPLPAIDDGAKTLEVAVAMCQMAAADGTTHLVATPHCNYRYKFDPEVNRAKLRELQEAVGEKPELLLGCDFHLSYDNIQDALAHPRRYTVGSTPYLLVEFSDFGVSPGVLESVHRLIAAGMRPIVTHPERNATLSRNHDVVLRLVELGCFVQVTASAFTGYWGEGIQTSAEQLLRRRLVHALASDAHEIGRASCRERV